MTASPAISRQLSCQCGQVRCEVIGAPIVAAICYCTGCQEGARRIEALVGAPQFREADGGTSLLTFRDDRFACITGHDLLVGYKIAADSPTRRMVASCCNAALFLKYEPGFWVSTYRARYNGADLPPVEMRNQIAHRQPGAPLPADVPAFQGFPLRLFARLLQARFAMFVSV